MDWPWTKHKLSHALTKFIIANRAAISLVVVFVTLRYQYTGSYY